MQEAKRQGVVCFSWQVIYEFLGGFSVWLAESGEAAELVKSVKAVKAGESVKSVESGKSV